MNSERWAEVERLYHAALQHRPESRAAFLRDADSEIRGEVEDLLTYEDRVASFIEVPAAELAERQGSKIAARVSPARFRLSAGDRLGPYEVLNPIGAGGMGEIYRARDSRLGRAVALKILSVVRLDQPGIRQRFEVEARAISHLNHPHICTLHDIGRHLDIDYLVLEYLEGESLAEILARGPIPEAEAIAVAKEICSALSYAHAMGIVHRDLKPANIILTEHGTKLIDFGLARLEQEAEMLHSLGAVIADGSLTVTGLILGTPQYMAPEQVERKPADARSDIFALGAVIFEMATGLKAFPGATSAEVMSAILASAPAEVPGPLGKLVARCLKKSPAERWQGADDVRRELDLLTVPQRRLWFLGTNRTPLLAATALLLASLAGDSGIDRPLPVTFRRDTRVEVLQSFPMINGRTTFPSGVIPGPNGKLYGTTTWGGARRQAGTVFELDPPAAPGDVWKQTLLYEFQGGDDGSYPDGGVMLAPNGSLYGTTSYGGVAGNGTVFELTPPRDPGARWTHTVLHHFTRVKGDGCVPRGPLLFGARGELYGTTEAGGVAGQGWGIVFQLTPPPVPGGEWAEKVIYTFRDPSRGTGPSLYLASDARGTLYGATCDTFGAAGVLYTLTPPPVPGGEWRQTVLHRFAGENGEGYCVSGGPVLGPKGAIYGATTFGYGGLGSVFQLAPPERAGDRWRETILHIFSGQDGSNPSNLALGADGRVYGIGSAGGIWNRGAIFELTPPPTPRGKWRETVLYSFRGREDGFDTFSGPAPVLDGRNLYGVAHQGGARAGGTVFKLSF